MICESIKFQLFYSHTCIVREKKRNRNFKHKFQKDSRQNRKNFYDYLQKCSENDLRIFSKIERRDLNEIHAHVLYCHSHFENFYKKLYNLRSNRFVQICEIHNM